MPRVRTTERGHLMRSKDGQRPLLDKESDNHTYVWCTLCSAGVCIHEHHSVVAPFFVAECSKYEPELPGMEAPIIEIPRYARA